MNRDAQRTLFHPFETGDIACPSEGRHILYHGAEPGFRPPVEFAAEMSLVQGFRPYFNALKAAGQKVAPRPDGGPFDGALVLAGRHRGQNEARIAAAIERVVPGGTIVVAGSSDTGIASLRKRLEKLVALEGYLPKYHGAAMWFARPSDAATVVAALEPQQGLAEGRFVAAPGMFSHDRVDAGSRLLSEHLPDSAKGAAADFGAGWGFLSVALAEPTEFFWHDLVGEKVEKKYDLIVMNPPFHQGRAAEPGIGQSMIGTASAALKPGGRLFMVQNRGLPYEQTLKARFSRVEEIGRDGAFRIVLAQR